LSKNLKEVSELVKHTREKNISDREEKEVLRQENKHRVQEIWSEVSKDRSRR
jgi:hypothetical protein